jgi:uncharacterized protein YjiS (DUF1127 family)
MLHGKSYALASKGRPGLKLGRLKAWLHLARARSREKRALAHLSAHQLRDLGLTEEQVRTEVAWPPWR